MSYAKKGTDQLVHPRGLISAFVAHCLDSIIPLLATPEDRFSRASAPMVTEGCAVSRPSSAPEHPFTHDIQ